MNDSAVPPETVNAYLAADFRVDADPPFVMHIGHSCTALANIYTMENVNSCAFITAFNPMGEPVDDAINNARQQAFARTLDQRGLPYLTGAGCDPKKEWPPEPSFLVLGVSLDAAKAIGRELRQNAIVWCGPDCLPHLILLR